MTPIPYLSELRVENLLVIELATLELSPGLNTLTGETGAGKTVLAKGLDLLLGAKTPKNVVRGDAGEAYVEGVFSLPDGWLAQHADGELADMVDVDADEIVLARRVTAQGRSRCLINGRTASLEMLRQVSRSLIAFYGQHEQRRLMLDDVQAELLDRSGDGRGGELLERYAAARRAAQAAARELAALDAEQQTSERELDLARFELAELQELELVDGEEAQLLAELKQLEEASEGQSACAQAEQMISGGEEGAGAQVLAQAAARLLEQFQSERARDAAQRLESVAIELDDLRGELESLAADWLSDPERQSEVSRRLEKISDLCRKHRCNFDGLFARQTELEQLVGAADDLPARRAQAAEKAAAALEQAQQAAAKLTAWRAKAAPKLAKAVTGTLSELALEGAEFSVALRALDGDGLTGLGERGAERVVFTFRPGPGLPEGELTQVASGGEVSRIMLALTSHCPLTEAGVLVLDEPDTGLGGHTAHGVAERLVKLSEARQVLVISHLPQIAARSDQHFVLDKQLGKDSTRTEIRRLDSEDAVIDELCRMAGYEPEDANARAAAVALRNGKGRASSRN